MHGGVVVPTDRMADRSAISAWSCALAAVSPAHLPTHGELDLVVHLAVVGVRSSCRLLSRLREVAVRRARRLRVYVHVVRLDDRVRLTGGCRRRRGRRMVAPVYMGGEGMPRSTLVCESGWSFSMMSASRSPSLQYSRET